MAITYTKKEREFAKEKRLHLVTLSARGLDFQSPVSEEDSVEILEFMQGFIRRRMNKLRADREANSEAK